MNYKQVTKNAIQIGLRTITALIPYYLGWVLGTVALPYLVKAPHIIRFSFAQLCTIFLASYVGAMLNHYYLLDRYQYLPALQTTSTQIAIMVVTTIGSFVVTLIYAVIPS